MHRTMTALLVALGVFAGCGGRPASADLTEEQIQSGRRNEHIAADEFYQREKARIEKDENLTASDKAFQLNNLEQGYKSTKRMVGGEDTRGGMNQK